MKKIGSFRNREVYWVNFSKILSTELPQSDWICVVSSSEKRPYLDNFDSFVRKSITAGLLEFKAHGKYGELLHDWFDETIVSLEVLDNQEKSKILTTWHNNDTLFDILRQAFFTSHIPERSNFDKIKIVCSDLDGIDRTNELQDYLERFNEG